MGAGATQREKLYRAYMEFFEVAERKRRWNLWDDVPWEKLDPSKATEAVANCVEAFCGVEMYTPDYTENGLSWNRESFGTAWFYANWGYEESKHALVFREYLLRSGLRSPEDFEEFEKTVLGKVWVPPYPDWRQMNVYAVLQETYTGMIYKGHKERAARVGDPVLERICFLTSRDEAAHAGFYRKCLEYHLAEDREGTIADIGHVWTDFIMPGFGLVPDYEKTVHDIMREGGLTTRDVLQHGVYSILRSIGVTRAELVRALHRNKVSEKAPGDAAGNVAAQPAAQGM